MVEIAEVFGEPKKNLGGRPKGSFKVTSDLKTFVKTYLENKMPMNWHHELFYDILQNKVIQGEDGKLCLNTDGRINKTILALAPRFHAKSQCFTINYPIWRIYKNPNIRIIIVSANEDIAVSFNRAITAQLENNHKLIKKYGSLVPRNTKKWGEKAIIVKRNSLEKDPTVAAIGIGGKMISKRADIIICDDIIDLETARTKAGRQKTLDWFENVLLPILEDDGILIVAGTVWYKDDIYDYLMKNSSFNIRLKLKALMYSQKYIREAKGKNSGQVRFLPYKLSEFPLALKAEDVFDDATFKLYELYTTLMGGVLWTAKWSFEKLMEKKKNMSWSAFLRQYLNEPGSEKERTFQESFIKKSLDNGTSKSLVSSWSNSDTDKYQSYGHLIVGIGVDLAISKKTTADNSAISVCGLNEKRERIILHLDFGRWSMDELKQKVIEAYHAYNPVKIRVENVAFQDLIRQELAEENIPVEGFHTTGAKKFSEEVGINHIAMLMEQGKVTIPSKISDKSSITRVNQLVSEMQTYTPDQHAGDVLMATWFAFDILRDFDNKLKETRGFFPATTIVEQTKRVKAANRVLLLNTKPRYFKFSFSSLVYIFRDMKDGVDFVGDEESFMIFCTREEKSIGYILEKTTGEIVGKIEGDMSALMFCNLLERAGHYFNKAQIVIDKNGEGEAIFNEMQNRFYPNLICTQPGDGGTIMVSDGFKIDASNLPLAVDHFRMKVNNLEITVFDDAIVREMGEMMAIEGDKLVLSYGTGQRFKTLSVATWLLDNYERQEKKLYNPNRKANKFINIPYLSFQK